MFVVLLYCIVVWYGPFSQKSSLSISELQLHCSCIVVALQVHTGAYRCMAGALQVHCRCIFFAFFCYVNSTRRLEAETGLSVLFSIQEFQHKVSLSGLLQNGGINICVRKDCLKGKVFITVSKKSHLYFSNYFFFRTVSLY